MKKEDIINVIERIIEIEEDEIKLKKVFFMNNLQISFNDKGKIYSSNKPSLSIKNKHINQKLILKITSCIEMISNLQFYKIMKNCILLMVKKYLRKKIKNSKNKA